MKIGVKTFDNRNFLKPFEKKVDFFEIMAVEGNDYKFLREFKLPIVIHSQHRKFDVNIADKSKLKRNLSSINFAIKIADLSNAKKIILHPGELDDKNCSEEQAISFIKNINDKRILIENVVIEGVHRYGAKPEEIKNILKETGAGFIFDINHALGTAVKLNEDYIDFMKEFLKLKPKHYHFGGQIIKNMNLPYYEREHLSLAESDFDLKEVLSIIPKEAEITLETTTDIKKTEDDVRIMKKMIGELGK